MLRFSVESKVVGYQSDAITPIKQAFARLESPAPTKLLAWLDECQIDYEEDDNLGVNLSIDSARHVQTLAKSASFDVLGLPTRVLDFLSRPDPPRVEEACIVRVLGQTLWDKLRAFQRTAVKFAVRRKKVMIADAMGAGKTLEALGACKWFLQEGPVLIVCPSILRPTWRNEILKWLEMDDVFIVEKAKDISKLPEPCPSFVITSYALLKAIGLLKPFPTMVLDECQFIKNPKSKRTQLALKLIHFAKNRLLLSGTPFNYPNEAYTQIRALYPEIYPTFFTPSDSMTFANRYCDPTRLFDEGWTFKGYENKPELHTVLSRFAIRRRKEVLLPFLPKKNRVCITLDALSQSQYDEIALEKDRETSRSQKAEFMQSYRLTCKYKRDSTLRFVKDYVFDIVMASDPNVCVLMFFYHRETHDTLEALCKAQGLSYFAIHGGTPTALREAHEANFQTRNMYRVGLLSLQTASAGLTLTKASVVVFAELLFGPNEMMQAEDRVHRMGQTHVVTIYYLLSPHTSDEIVFRLICKKERESTEILDGEAHPLAVSKRHIEEWDNPGSEAPRIITKRMKQE